MSNVEADDSTNRETKKENGAEDGKNDEVDSQEQVPVDFNRLYGDLYQKLLNTPVQEIFPHSMSPGGALTNIPGLPGVSDIPNSHEKENGGSPKRNVKEEPVNMFSPNIPDVGAIPPELLAAPPFNGGLFPHGIGSPLHTKPEDTDFFKFLPLTSNNDVMDKIAYNHEPIDIPKLVERFRITLERYGVSQRFAARYIMQDTSQGNLSFLMEKGKTKVWEDLSLRGRIPYIKMKAWLENKEQQMMTLEMIKQSMEMKKQFSPKEPYNRRERFSMYQLQVLCNLFEESSNPPMHTRSALAQQLNIPLDRVNVWFQNQRARGFPAKKILQNSMYTEGLTPESVTAQNGRDSPKDSKKATHMKDKHILNPIGAPIVGDPFALLKNFTASKLAEQSMNDGKASPTTPNKYLGSPIVPGIPLMGNTPPMDFTSFPFTSIPLPGQSTSGLGNLQGDQNFTGVQLSSTENLQNNQNHDNSDKLSEDIIAYTQNISKAGASKRKRGKVPRQIVRSASPMLPDEWNGEKGGTGSNAKRAKLNETGENGVNLVKKSDKQSGNKSNGIGTGVDKYGAKSNQNLNLNDVIGDITNTECGPDGQPIPTETLVALKSVCAHFLVEDKEKDKEKEKVVFEEPDLD